MNKRLLPWVITMAGFDFLLLLIYIATRLSFFMEALFGVVLGVGAVFVSTCGFVGKAIELRRGRNGALIIALGVPVALMVITIVVTYCYETVHPTDFFFNSVKLLTSAAIYVFTVPIIALVLTQIALAVSYHTAHRKAYYDYDETERVCFRSKKALWVCLIVVLALAPVLFVVALTRQSTA